MYFTHKNHVRYQIGGRDFGWRTNSLEKFCVQVGSVDLDYYNKGDYTGELVRTADLVLQDLGPNLVLFLSGGTDSEIVLRNFLKIGFKPECYTIKFKGDFNQGDVSESIELAESLGVKLNLIDFDVKDFYFSGEAAEFGKLLQCTQITYLMVYYCIKKLGLPAVMGGELLLKRNVGMDPSTWYYCLRENEDCSAMRFSQLYGIPLVNEWFSYTPELMLYWLEHENIKKLVTEKYNYKLSSVSSKNRILRELQPDIRERKKTHGFEALLGFNYEAYRDLAATQITRLEDSIDGIEYTKCIEMLRGSYGNN